jgi:AcrR family transcriptional regulator
VTAEKTRAGAGAAAHDDARPPGRGNLDRDEVVAAALRLTRAVGLSGLTMRGLAGELGVSAMAAYYWVPSKRALIDLVLESVLDEINSRERTGSWRERLSVLATASREVVLSYPGVGATLLNAPAGPRAREMIAEALALLREAGYSGDRLTRAWSTYHSFMLGQFTLANMPGAGPRPPARGHRDEITHALQEARGQAAFEWGLRHVLDALEAAAHAD